MATRKAIILLLLILPLNSFADYCVTGAGSTIVNGYYTQGANLYGYPAYYPVDGQDTVMEYGLSNYYEIRSLSQITTNGYYHDSAGAGGSYEGIDTINNIGVAPVPTVVDGEGTCDIPQNEPQIASSTGATIGDLSFGLAIIIGLMSLGLVGFAFNTLNKRKKPWTR